MGKNKKGATNERNLIDFWRQMDIVSPADLKMPITVIGAGGIGSPLILALAKMGCEFITVYDGDKVESHNVPNQIFRIEDIGKPKVEAVKEVARSFAGVEIEAKNEFYKNQKLAGIVISAVDSMKTRSEIWAQVKHKPGITLYIEARMGGEEFLIYAINPCDPDDIELYEEDLYTDEEASQAPCTARAIIYNVFVLAGILASIVKKFVKGEKYPPTVIFDLKTLFMQTRKREEV